LWIRFLGWEVPPLRQFALVLFALSTPQVIEGIRLQQPGLLVGILIAASAVLIRKQRLWFAGSLLAVSTIKPQMALLPVAWWALWAAADWTKRRQLFWGFMATIALLTVGGELILPGWITRFANGMTAYRAYALGAMSPLEFLAGRATGLALGGILLLSVAAICWKSRREPADSARCAVVLSLVLLTATLAMPIKPLFNQVLLMPSVFLALRDWNLLWQARRLACVLFLAGLAWPWVAASWVLSSSPQLWRLPLLASFLLTFIMLLVMVRPAAQILRGQSPDLVLS
jgi:hypothetical protein